MAGRPIGFDVANSEYPGSAKKYVTQVAFRPLPDDTTVAPAPQDGGLYPAISPGHMQQGQPPAPIGFEGDGQKPAAPIGFEMHEVSPVAPEGGAANGQSEVKVPIESKGLDSEAVLLDPNDPSKGVKVSSRASSVMNIQDEDNMFFNDGVRKIDYVLAYEPEATSSAENRKRKREYYEVELQKEGLELEYEAVEKSKSGKTAFVKIHAPWDVLARGAELMNMKMPLAPNDMGMEATSVFDCIPTPFDLDSDLVEMDDNYFTAPFNRNRMEQYIIKDKESFFTNAQRSRIVYAIMARTYYEDEPEDKDVRRRFGVKKLVANNAYSGAYPLHDGKYTSQHSILTRGKENDRHLLWETWARPGRWYKYQPLDVIRNYFGEKIGIYFAWLGFYTSMLIPASIMGLVAFIYGCATMMDDVITNEICDENKAGNMTMCPLCDKGCSYWKMEQSCYYSRATYLFDNPATVAFTIFMALWACVFHEMWKRKQAELEYDWDVADFEQEEETVRPEFEAKVRRRKPNPVNKNLEPFVPFYSKCCRYFSTVTVIFFFIAIVVGAVVGVILYRIIIRAALYASDTEFLRGRAGLIASGTAACINLVIIIILNFIYQRIAEALTEFEHHRTESEWEDAFTFKMFCFQCVNFYSSISYIAFMKGRFVGRPGDYDYNMGYRQEECDPAGCLIELCLQLGIIMVGKQALANFKEVILPKLMVWFKSRSVKADKEDKIYTHWERDYNLADQPKLGLFDEYLEMVIQYGFVTIFVAAFPLAPLFALLNNIIEIRLDAYKFITQWKRPLALRAQDLGIWFGILQGLSAFAVISNALIIAFTSEFIPRLVYKFVYSNDGTMHDYHLNFTMSYFNTSNFQEQSIPDNPNVEEFGVVTECRYRDFRHPPGSTDEYEYTMAFWHVFAARLAFIVVFENLVVFLSWLIMYLIPDMPYTVKMQMLREKYLSKQALFHAEELLKSKKDD